MALSTQRLIIMFISLNMLLGMSLEFYYHPTEFTTIQTDIDIAMMEQYEERFTDESTWYSGIPTAITDFVIGVGSVSKWALEILWIFAKGINPLNIPRSLAKTTLERAIVDVITFFRAFMMIVAMLEAFFLYYSRKT